MTIHREDSRWELYGDNQCLLDLKLSLTTSLDSVPLQISTSCYGLRTTSPSEPLITAPTNLGVESHYMRMTCRNDKHRHSHGVAMGFFAHLPTRESAAWP